MKDDSDGPSSAAISAASCRSIGSSVTATGPDQLAQRGEVRGAPGTARSREQRRLPLPVVVDAVEAAVVQLVADGEGDLQVLVGQRAPRSRRDPLGDARAVAADSSVPVDEVAAEGLAQRTPWLGQVHDPSMPTARAFDAPADVMSLVPEDVAASDPSGTGSSDLAEILRRNG